MASYIHLDRQFSRVLLDSNSTDEEEFYFLGLHKPKGWPDLEEEYRTVVLAEAGSGKTEEFRHRARILADQSRFSFFIRIEDIDENFYRAFEVGTEKEFTTWQQSTENAWFFLDSVDEARLEHPRDFERAIRRFSNGIQDCAHRAHVYISSRPYAWRAEADCHLLDDVLYLARPTESDEKSSEEESTKGSLLIYGLEPLDSTRIRSFAQERSTPNLEEFLKQVERTDLWQMAERPFDLDAMLEKWRNEQTLGTRLDLLRYNIDKRLQDVHNTDRAARQPLNLERARIGARQLAASVLLTGDQAIRIPDNTTSTKGVNAEEVLNDWDPLDVRALLERGVFNEVVYGTVRFRHRDVRELLAAEWLHYLIQQGRRREVESLVFRRQYGVEFICPKLRPTLPWLLLFDDQVRKKATAISPEILVEGGDPSLLDTQERARLLEEITERIISDTDTRSARNNDAIARIANSDLSDLTLSLIQKHHANDDALFFLGRLVWQGDMGNCVASLLHAAVEANRNVYSRIAAARAVMTCGTVAEIRRLRIGLLEANEELPRSLLAEMVSDASPDLESVEFLISALCKLPPYKRFSSSGLGSALHRFIDKFEDESKGATLERLLDGLKIYLDRDPYIERRDCRVSEEFAWLLNHAVHGVELFAQNRDLRALRPALISTLLMVPALRFWQGEDYDEYKTKLMDLVPKWPELNDELYWASIKQAREADGALIDDWRVSWLGHFWMFERESFPRLLKYIRDDNTPINDKSVALSTALRVFAREEQSPDLLTELQAAIAGNIDLEEKLENFLNPKMSDADRAHQQEEDGLRKEQREREDKFRIARESWIAELIKNPNRVRNPPGLSTGDYTKDHYWLLDEIRKVDQHGSRHGGEQWLLLSNEFGEEVAAAYRDAMLRHWKSYEPPSRTEREPGRTPYAVILGLAGIDIDLGQPNRLVELNEPSVAHALLYMTWELNGFPSWLEAIHKLHPHLVEEAAAKELRWELVDSASDNSRYGFLHDIVYHAPWLHVGLARIVFDWIVSNPSLMHDPARHLILELLFNGGIAIGEMKKIATQQILLENDSTRLSSWYALLVDSDPEHGIEVTQRWLSGLKRATATHAAQSFLVSLVGSRHSERAATRFGEFKTPQHLKTLFLLASQFIRPEEDVDHPNGEAYSPELRDNAQEARDRLFNWLAAVPGKPTYQAIRQLAYEHPDQNIRIRMERHALERAQVDGDLEPWSASQVASFAATANIQPKSHRQLFDVGVGKINELKYWLETGNDSPWKTWSRVDNETEMRNLIGGWLNQQCSKQHTTAQELELANGQRIDLALDNPSVSSAVPVELKLLDKQWTGPKLCERLRNQLVGDYLREHSSGCGIFLLIWQGFDPDRPARKWRIGGKNVDLHHLVNALRQHWDSISEQFPNVEAVEIVLIDLTVRSNVSAD